ncbi:MAG: AzlD domain-containing protein [Chloroflexota bacterium]
MESQLTVLVIIVALSAVNYLLRLLPLTLLSHWKAPRAAEAWFRQIPLAVLSAIVFQQLFLKGGSFSWRWEDYTLLGAAAAAAIMALTRNLFLVAFGAPAVVFLVGWLARL